ncbi:MAG: collagen-like protein [Pseudomonadota bacterium]
MDDSLMEILEILTEQVLVFDDGETVLVLDEDNIEALDMAEQGPPGPTGAAGPIGPPGANGGGYVHSQSSAEVLWIINHNLGVRPAISVTDTGGSELDAEVLHVSMNQCHIMFNAPTAGLARVN